MTEDTYEVVMETLRDLMQGVSGVSSSYSRWLDVADEAGVRLDYETRVSIIERIGDSRDVSKWVTGDLLVGVVKGLPHGQKMKTLGDIARATGRTPAELRETMDCSEFWPPYVRKAMLAKTGDEKPLTWSHFNRARRGLELAEAEKLLNSAWENDWSVQAMEAHKIESKSPEKSKALKKLERAIAGLEGLAGAGLPAPLWKKVVELRDELTDFAEGLE